MSTCNWLDLQRLGSQPIMPKTSQDTDPEGEETVAPCVPTGSSHVFSGGCSRELCVTLNTMTMY